MKSNQEDAHLESDDSRTIFILLRIISGLSIFGSIWVISEIVLDRRKRSMCYHRLIFGLAFFNLLTDIWFFVGEKAQNPYLFNQEILNWTVGSVSTCRLSGFSIYMGTLAIPWYNAALAIYYYLAICRRWEEERIKKNFERHAHILIGPTSLIIATFPLFFDMYGAFYTYCYAVFTDDRESKKIQDIFESFTLVSVLLSACTTAICTVLLIHFRHCSAYIRIPEFERTATGIKMTALYTTAFFLAWVFPVVYMGQAMIFLRSQFIGSIPITKGQVYAAFVYLTTALPSQGFLNWIIYLWPRFRKIREDSGSCCVIQDVLFWSCTHSKTWAYDGDCYLGSGMVENVRERTDNRITGCPRGCDPDTFDPDLFDPDFSDIEMEHMDSESSGENEEREIPNLSTVAVKEENYDNDVNSELSFEQCTYYVVDGVDEFIDMSPRQKESSLEVWRSPLEASTAPVPKNTSLRTPTDPLASASIQERSKRRDSSTSRTESSQSRTESSQSRTERSASATPEESSLAS